MEVYEYIVLNINRSTVNNRRGARLNLKKKQLKATMGGRKMGICPNPRVLTTKQQYIAVFVVQDNKYVSGGGNGNGKN